MNSVSVHALRTVQGGFDVFAFFMPGERIMEIAEISRIGRDGNGAVAGFQRPEIVAHVRGIAEYLDRGDVLFPNAILLALAPGARFSGKRGPPNSAAASGSTAGVLSIPNRPGRKAAWIVDGQQRAMALAQSGARALQVPVVAFVSGDLSVHREQFVLVNKARPLDKRLIDELLPSIGPILPRDLSVRRVPSALCAVLNQAADSPFRGLIRRPSGGEPDAVITDSHVTAMIRRSMTDPRGALAACTGADGSPDMDAMYALVRDFWSAVRNVFPEAWSAPPDRSRLTHGAGIAAMGVLMDQVMTRESVEPPRAHALAALNAIAPRCRWTAGTWEGLGRAWNDLQCTSRDIRALSNHLVALDRDARRFEAA